MAFGPAVAQNQIALFLLKIILKIQHAIRQVAEKQDWDARICFGIPG